MTHLTLGEPAPWFVLPSDANPTYHFDTVGGFRTILCFFGSTQQPEMQLVFNEFAAAQDQLAKLNAPFFGLSIDPNDQGLVSHIRLPSYFKLLWDFERQVSRLYGVATPLDDGDLTRFSPMTFILNERMQVIRVIPIDPAETHVAQVLDFLAELPPLPAPHVAHRQAPVLFIPHVLPPALCQELIQLYERNGGEESGFMRQLNGKTVAVLDGSFKKRKDFNLTDPAVLEPINTAMVRRVKPEIEKSYQFNISRFERHLVACYEATNQGFFNRHRDNTTKGTAHRRFAMTINLNDEFDGGCLRFSEFGAQLYRPQPGEAIIFSCSLLHEATPVTAGRRFALLSFFYDEAAAQIREQNRQFLSNEEYRVAR